MREPNVSRRTEQAPLVDGAPGSPEQRRSAFATLAKVKRDVRVPAHLVRYWELVGTIGGPLVLRGGR